MKYVQRKTKNLSAKKRKKIKSFIEPVNCPVTWIFCSRKSNNKINRLHERSLGIFNNDYESTYEELLSNSTIMTRIYTAWLPKNTKLIIICQWEISRVCLILKISMPYISI